jgi:ABC-type transporter Mla MlaB component
VPAHDPRPPPPAGDAEPSAPARAAVWRIGPAITRADIPGLCRQLAALLHRSGAAVVICQVGAITDPDAVTIEALARLQLVARRLGRRIWLSGASGRLRELLALTGLCDVLPLHEGLPLEAGWQTEQREQAIGVEERVDPDDPAG